MSGAEYEDEALDVPAANPSGAEPVQIRIVNIVARYQTTIRPADMAEACRAAGARVADIQRSVQVRSYNEYNVVIGQNGRVTSLADTCFEQCAFNMWELANTIGDVCGFNCSSSDLGFQNVMGIFRVPGTVDVALMAAELGTHRVSYERRSIHKATYTTTVVDGGKTHHVTLNIWPSGQVNLMGSASIDIIRQAVKNELPVILRFCNRRADEVAEPVARNGSRSPPHTDVWTHALEATWANDAATNLYRKRTRREELYEGPVALPAKRFSTELSRTTSTSLQNQRM